MKTFLRNRNIEIEPVWHVQIVMLAAIGLQLLVPESYTLGFRYVLVAIEGLLLIALSFTTPNRPSFKSTARRLNVILLIGLAGLANCYALAEVARRLLETGRLDNGKELILAAVNIYLTNIIIFGLLYWEMDGGGPGDRLRTLQHDRDFMFPQDQNPDFKPPAWRPTFVDYVYVSATNGMAFSPTDTMPLSRRAKLLMLVQATISLVTVALVAARAVNILS